MVVKSGDVHGLKQVEVLVVGGWWLEVQMLCVSSFNGGWWDWDLELHSSH